MYFVSRGKHIKIFHVCVHLTEMGVEKASRTVELDLGQAMRIFIFVLLFYFISENLHFNPFLALTNVLFRNRSNAICVVKF